MQIGIQIQRFILEKWGQAGSDLYVSISFVAVLIIVGAYVFLDAMRISKSGGKERVSYLARKLQGINLPPMITFKTANVRISFWFTLPVGFATGMLAATIAVGGFIGVPGMIYMLGVSGLIASASELVIAFVMGLGGSINWAMHGMMDIRLVLIILAGSLAGVQLGAIGTTYVKEYMIKLVMCDNHDHSRREQGACNPRYLYKLGVISIGQNTVAVLGTISFLINVLRAAYRGRGNSGQHVEGEKIGIYSKSHG